MYPARDTLQHVIKAWCKVAWLKGGILTFVNERSKTKDMEPERVRKRFKQLTNMIFFTSIHFTLLHCTVPCSKVSKAVFSSRICWSSCPCCFCWVLMLLQSILVCMILLLCIRPSWWSFFSSSSVFLNCSSPYLGLHVIQPFLLSGQQFLCRWHFWISFFLFTLPLFALGESLHWRFTHFYCLRILFISFSLVFYISCCWSSASFSLKRSIMFLILQIQIYCYEIL